MGKPCFNLPWYNVMLQKSVSANWIISGFDLDSGLLPTDCQAIL